MIHCILPVGTVVVLQKAKRRFMIIGVKAAREEGSNAVYDYIGVPYPEGFMGDEYKVLFNHEDINDIVFRGYSNDEHLAFLAMLNRHYSGNAENAE